MNSFQFLERGIEAELATSSEAVESGRRSSRTRSTSIPRTARSHRCARRSTRTTTAISPSPTSCPWRPTEEMLKEAA